jgi:hypothetical protein
MNPSAYPPAPAGPPPKPKRSVGLLLVTLAFGAAVFCSAGVTVAYFMGLFSPEEEPVEVDAGPPDAGPPDAGPPDAGPPDSGPPDSGPPDAGVDAYVPPPPTRGPAWWHQSRQERSRRR